MLFGLILDLTLVLQLNKLNPIYFRQNTDFIDFKLRKLSHYIFNLLGNLILQNHIYP